MGSPDSYRVLVLGASGQFGKRLCQRLIEEDLTLLLAGRDEARLTKLKTHLLTLRPKAGIETVSCDILHDSFSDALLSCTPNVVVHLAGPFQNQNYVVAKACLKVRIPYIDMADGREFVSKFHMLDAEAKEAGIFLITGASTVPALSSAILDHALADMPGLQEVDYGICAGLKTGLGSATLKAVLSYCGKSYAILKNSRSETVYGLDEPRFHDFPNPVGRRFTVNCEIPDLELFPVRYPMLRTMRFGSCIDVPGLAHLLSLMSRVVQKGLIKDWDFLSNLIALFMNAVRSFGSVHSGLFMRYKGRQGDLLMQKLFEIIARDGSGLEIPVTPVVILIKRILAGKNFPAGAYPCMGLLPLDDFRQELVLFPITFEWRAVE